jgi:hypothetical protein
MRNAIFAMFTACLALTAATPRSPAAEECMIGDAALCLLAAPKCHWDSDRRGCYPGPGAFRDACAAHEDKGVCVTSSLGCQWSDAGNKCESKTQ